MKKCLSVGLTVSAFICFATCAFADETFDLAWSGASFGNGASAIGTITMDPALIGSGGYVDNSGFFFPPATPFVDALSITVTGSGAGDGTFTLSDFDTVLFNPNGATLDFTSQLVGQPTSGAPWGTTGGGGGDFNLFNRTGVGGNAPDGVNDFELGTNAGTGDVMILTSFLPQAPTGTPEPGTMALIGGLTITGAGFLRRRRFVK